MLLRRDNAFLCMLFTLKRRMSIKTRSKSKKESKMSATEGKFDTVLTKMDDLLKAKAKQEVKFNSILEKLENLEISQKKTADDVKDLKQSYGFSEEQVTEVKNDIAEKASHRELTKLEKKIDDLENRSKRNNILIWGLREDADKEYDSLELFLAHNFFGNHMGIKDIEVMRAHRTNIKERAATATKPRPIHVYLLRYTDKVMILKAAAKALKDKIECIVNNRPTTAVSDDPNDCSVLTPNHDCSALTPHHFLLQRATQLLPSVFVNEDLFSRKGWRKVQFLTDHYWKRWTREYVPTLQRRPKWVKSR